METKDTKIKNIIKCTAKAAITIEATISLTLFMFIVVFLAGFITAVDKQLSTQIKMNRLAENMAKQMFYIKQVDEITDYSEKLKEYKDKFKENISEIKVTTDFKMVTVGRLIPVKGYDRLLRCIKKLKDEGLWIAAADMDGQTFYEQNLTGALGLVIGSEGFGISRLVKQNCDFTVKMPMIGNVTSLNASVAAGILLYEIFKQRSGNK